MKPLCVTACISAAILMMHMSVSQAGSLDGNIEIAKKTIAQQLRDPDSVRFLSADFLHSKNVRGEPTDVVCGKLSAKNGFGGMSAASPFLYMVKEQHAYLTDPSIALVPYEAEIGQMAYAHLCLGR